MKEPEYLYMIKQGSDSWFKHRLGIITASNINTLVTGKGKPAKNEKMRQYACKIAAERAFEFMEDNFQTFQMMRGHFEEELAREIYNDTFEEVIQCGIIRREIEGVLVGASPDGIVLRDGGIEIKSRIPKFQFETIIADKVPDEYINQIQMTLMVSGRKWWDFVQFSNGMPLFVKRVFPDPERQALIVTAIVEFEAEVQKVLLDFAEKSANLVPTKRVKLNFDEGIITAS